MDDDEETPTLSGQALAALQEFYSERSAQEELANKLETAISNNEKLSMDMFKEDWNASQFWYSETTAKILAEQLLDGATNETSIAVVSAPSAFIELKNFLNLVGKESRRPRLTLLEFDNRFEALEEFVHYDYQKPLQLPVSLRNSFDRILCDPPFLNEECQTKAAMTARWLSRSSDTKIIVCTGQTMESLIHKVYPGTKTTTFEPEHAQGRLSNPFRCYANFECSAWTWE